MPKFSLIVAATEELGIGYLNNLPWRLPKDMAFFKQVTTKIPKNVVNKENVQNAVIMGRVTWESIPPKFRPLENRLNIVISRNPSYDLQLADDNQNVILVSSFEEALKRIDETKNPRVFVIGGAQMYRMAIHNPECDSIILTRIKTQVNCDTFFPEINIKNYRLAEHKELEEYVEGTVPEGVQEHKDMKYEFTFYKRRSF
ncbi:hypothetical protein G6F68_008376 [Rhizopus microsporus]|nr:hypothetical protein G6F69_008582 [Rhizopus microsporus]KAG1235945.1 hypothetical protein G6F67_002382 [Rhizopus microsporus]KAG1259050.1 hypothetical protein G6F68_008376 [Rhizopus microsporus]